MNRIVSPVVLAGVLCCNPLLAVDSVVGSSTQPASAAARKEADRQWYQDVIVDGFEKHGRHDPAWNEDARTIVRAVAGLWNPDHSPTGDEQDEIYLAGLRVTKKGCDDPLVLYAVARDHYQRRHKMNTVVPPHLVAAQRVVTTDYHPMIKWRVLLRAAEVRTWEGNNYNPDPLEAQRLLEKALALTPQLAADKRMPREEIIGCLDLLGSVAIAVEGDRRRAWELAYREFERATDDKSLLLTLKADYLRTLAWDARGSGWATEVSEGGWKSMAEYLEQAEKLAEEAWRLDPSHPYPAIVMMGVELGQGRGRERMETWFNRAIQADPNCLEAYDEKMYYLDPRWHGSVEDMVSFGRECLEQGDWEAGIPLMLVEAHLEASKHVGDGPSYRPHPEYFRDNDDAWQDVEDVYHEYLQRVPESIFHRSRFAMLAAWCGQWEEADRQLKALNGRKSWRAFWRRDDYEKIVEDVARHLNQPTPRAAAHSER